MKEPTDERQVAIRDKQRTEDGKTLYGRRNHTVEPVFGIIKEAMGFRGFSLRGKEKVSGEWTLVCLAYNLRRLHKMIGGSKNGGGTPKSPPIARNPITNLKVGVCLGRNPRGISRRIHRLAVGSTAKLILTPKHSYELKHLNDPSDHEQTWMGDSWLPRGPEG